MLPLPSSWPGPVPAIHVLRAANAAKTWMPGTEPGHDGAWVGRLGTKAHASIDRPNPARNQFQQMVVGIAEIDAVATARPGGPCLHGDALLRQPRLPSRQLV